MLRLVRRRAGFAAALARAIALLVIVLILVIVVVLVVVATITAFRAPAAVTGLAAATAATTAAAVAGAAAARHSRLSDLFRIRGTPSRLSANVPRGSRFITAPHPLQFTVLSVKRAQSKELLLLLGDPVVLFLE